ncbi:caspase-6-like [Patiria miniata]|uniref:Caspase-6 n=1 Tax=Patiria miniata TaxID=46514 RepID=A0A914A903_PATMI|nr:caspase-6-like [Patiria miniata]XP_038060323.1 caspase-6-like [Patiria miniata]
MSANKNKETTHLGSDAHSETDTVKESQENPSGNDTATDARTSTKADSISLPLGRPALRGVGHQTRNEGSSVFRFPGFVESLSDEIQLQYRMDHKKRGLAMVFNHENFSLSVGMNRRIGTELDALNLRKYLGRLGFEVVVFQDLRIAEIKRQFERAAFEMDHSEADCFLCSFLTHGDDGIIYGYDGTLPLQELFDYFRGENCKSLIGKPKIFLIQACRGDKHEIGLETDALDKDEPDSYGYTVVDGGPTLTVPAGADMLICYSVTQGFYSHRDTSLGSWFIQALSQVMEQYGATMEFTTILTVVNRLVAQRSVERCLDPRMIGKKQIPCFMSMLTKQLVFTPK